MHRGDKPELQDGYTYIDWLASILEQRVLVAVLEAMTAEITRADVIIETLRTSRIQKSSSQSDMDANLKVRTALSGIQGSISADILKDREDRI